VGAAVATVTCPHCGAPAPAGGTFCPSCGGALLAPAPVSPGASPSFGGPPLASPHPYPVGFGALPDPGATSRPIDLRAISHVTIAAVIALVSTAVSVATLFLPTSGSLDVAATSSSTTTLTLSLATLEILSAILGIALILGLLELWFYRSAFHDLSPIDRRFSTPATLTLLALVSLVLIAATGAAVVVLLYQAIHCAGGGKITSTCLSFGTVGGLLLLIALFAIFAFVGWIGFLLGVWRLGTRYREGLFKAGAILLIFPVLNVIGVILILVGARNVRARLESSGAMPSFG
jgi:Protein of unknown function (DUF973)